jgi:hypothetical protein
MSGVRGRSGPPGHLHNAKYPWRSFWRRRALRAQDRWILGVLDSYSSGLLSDRPDATEAEQRCVEVAQIARGASMLILAEAAHSGFIVKDRNGKWDLSPGAKELSRFLAVERQCLQTLGLGRRAKVVGTITERLATIHGAGHETT